MSELCFGTFIDVRTSLDFFYRPTLLNRVGNLEAYWVTELQRLRVHESGLFVYVCNVGDLIGG